MPVHGDDVAVFMALTDQMHVRLPIESREITLVLVRHEAEKFSLGDHYDLEPDAEEDVLLRLLLLSLSLDRARLYLAPDLVSKLHGLEV